MLDWGISSRHFEMGVCKKHNFPGFAFMPDITDMTVIVTRE